MGLPPDLEKKANEILKDLVGVLKPIQANYFEGKNKMWQGIKTPTITPKDGNQIAPDKSKKPTDQKESWEDMAISLPALMEIATAVDVYEGSQKWGYSVRGEIEIATKNWIKVINVGPEKYRDHDWIEVSKPDLVTKTK